MLQNRVIFTINGFLISAKEVQALNMDVLDIGESPLCSLWGIALFYFGKNPKDPDGDTERSHGK